MCEYLIDPLVQDVISFFLASLLFSVPVVLYILLWRFVTADPRQDVITLGLEDADQTQRWKRGTSVWSLLLRVLTGVLTFTLGVLAFEAVHPLS